MFLDGGYSDLKEIAENLSKPAPLLETVELSLQGWKYHPLVLPPSFFEAFISPVRALTLRDGTLSPGPCKFSKLTTFNLQTWVNHFTSATLTDALEQMPLLRVFNARFSRAREYGSTSDRIVTLPYLEEVTIETVDHRGVPLANPVLPALRLPSARKVFVRSAKARGAPSTPILPLSFEERPPNLCIARIAHVTFEKDTRVIRLARERKSELKLRIDSDIPYAFTPTTFGDIPFYGMHRLIVSLRRTAIDTVFFIKLRSMRGLKSLGLGGKTAALLTQWTGEDEQAGICPALATLYIIDTASSTPHQLAEELKRVRRRAGVPIASVKIRKG